MDFFTAVNHSVQRNAPTDADDVDAFAHAIAFRYNNSSYQVTARLTPTAPAIPPSLRFPSSPMAKMSLASRSSSQSTAQVHSFPAIPPSALEDLVNDPSVLIIDIRPHAAYSSARLPSALSLSVPSTLLKRPLFSLSRLSAMLSSQSARTRFSTWRSASRILVYDADAIAIPDSSNIQGLLRKFKNDGFEGDLSWLQGGFQAVWRERRALIDTNPPTLDAEPDEEDDQSNLPTSVASPAVSLLRPRHLPMSAFSSSSTTANSASGPSKVKLRSNLSMSIPLPTSQPLPRNAFNPFFDAVRQNVELSQGITERIPLRLPRRVHKRIADLPCNWLQEIAKKAECAPRVHHHRVHSLTHPLSFSAAANHPPSSSEDTSDSDTSPDSTDIEEGTEALAMQFYRIELAEQRRLMGVMERHARESGLCTNSGAKQASLSFPYSITAGIEKGTKNRYRHIWPFEHARVRLHCRSKDQKRKGEEGSVKRDSDDADSDDYVNASYVQPLGTRRRYIATQGPLDATFNDFWRLCWEQNVHVIVMLTKEVEGSTIKCGAYWVDDGERTFGPLTLKLVSKVGLPGDVDLERHEPQSRAGDGFFESSIPHKSTPLSAAHLPNRRRRKPVSTIKRTFELSHRRYPHLGSRKVVQLQYLEWPDMNVPDDARGVLGLMKEIEKGVDDTWDSSGEIGGFGDSAEYIEMDKEMCSSANLDERSGIAKHALGEKERRPVLLHCSAGVGRTGGFIAVDAVLSSVRSEMRNRKGQGMESAKEIAMEVDDDASQALNVREGMMTVSIPLSAGGEGQRANTWGAGAGLVMHVPAVVIPETTGRDIARTPMQVDGEIGSRASDEIPGASTREWAQAVSDQTASIGGAAFRSSASGTIPILHLQHQHICEQFRHIRHPRPMSKSTSSSSSSALPIDSDDSGSVGLRPMVKESSSLGTSISGSSEEEKFGGMKRTESPLKTVSGMVSEESEGESGREAQRRRTRTVSAPHTHLESTSHPSGVGSSPLASSTTSWSMGRRDRKQMARLAKAGIIGPSSDDGPPPSQAMSSTADKHEKAPSLPPHVHLRSDPDSRHLLSKSSPPLSHASLSPEHRLAEEKEPRSTTVDYKEPRRLHDLHPPVPLSSFEEPIWEVVQDMREQRMSLCQSLRQYVFVHAAIIEGALMIVDEEREREREAVGCQMEAEIEVSAAAGTSGQPGVSVGSANSSGPPGDCSSVTFAPPPTSLLHVRPSFTMLANASEVSMTSISSTGKRSASPTELLKEGKKGEVLLSKRPSIKRKQTLPSERGLSLDPRTTTFYKQSQSLHQGGHGSSSASGSAAGLHLQRMTMPSSSSSSSSSLS